MEQRSVSSVSQKLDTFRVMAVVTDFERKPAAKS
jgi:hypothetical protein